MLNDHAAIDNVYDYFEQPHSLIVLTSQITFLKFDIVLKYNQL